MVAPDLVGMGRSDKPADQDAYTMAGHTSWLGQWLDAVDLHGVTLFCQDWGGTLGLLLLPDHGDRIDRVIASNTGLPDGSGMSPFLEEWLAFSQSVDVLPVGALVQGGSTRELSGAEVAAYEAPFPDGSYQAAPKRFPALIPMQPDNPGCPWPGPPGRSSRRGRSRSSPCSATRTRWRSGPVPTGCSSAVSPGRTASPPGDRRGEPLHPGGCARRARVGDRRVRRHLTGDRAVRSARPGAGSGRVDRRVRMTTVATVRGPVAPADLGRTYMHEHIFVLSPDVQQVFRACGSTSAAIWFPCW